MELKKKQGVKLMDWMNWLRYKYGIL